LRAGLQMDLGSFAQLSVESDINEAARMPFVAKQRTLSASLRVAANPTVQLLLGGQRRHGRRGLPGLRGHPLHPRRQLHAGRRDAGGQDKPSWASA